MDHGEPERPRTYLPLPDRVSNDRPLFHRYLAEVLALTGGELPPGPGPTDPDEYEWEHAARAAVAAGLPPRGPWPEAVFAALIRTVVHDPNPSFNRQLIEPALAVAGRRKVQEALLGVLESGTKAEKAGAARAWYWAQMPLGSPGLVEWRARFAAEGGTRAREVLAELQASWREAARREATSTEDLRTRWREAALREFVSNEDLDVRRCILPGLSLKPALYPDDLKDLVATAVRIARAHPDDYIRHRVEHQI
jgi:hypothetical protein